jgi:hypothetical protein
MRETPDQAGFSETAIEALLAAGNFDQAVGWTLLGGTQAGPGGNALLHWMTLIDIGDAEGHVPHGSSLKYAEDLAIGGALSPVMLQRLSAVLEALDYEVPEPITQGAQAAVAGDLGPLPDTKLLPALHEAVKQKAVGKVILLTLALFGSGAATSAHTLALGEAIDALKGVGLEAEARRLAFEAVFEAWPRRPGG